MFRSGRLRKRGLFRAELKKDGLNRIEKMCQSDCLRQISYAASDPGEPRLACEECSSIGCTHSCYMDKLLQPASFTHPPRDWKFPNPGPTRDLRPLLHHGSCSD